MNLGDNIRERREERDLTKAELGRRAGVSEVCISYWERGVIKQVGHERLIALAAALGTTASALIGDPGLARHDAELLENAALLIDVDPAAKPYVEALREAADAKWREAEALASQYPQAKETTDAGS